MAKAEPPYMEEKEIQALEAMGEGLIEQLQQHMTPEWAVKVRKLLRSYRLAARPTNAAWRYFDTATDEPENAGIIQCCMEDFQSALSDYAPLRVKQPAMEKLHRVELLRELYDKAQNNGEALEVLYQATCQAEKELEEG